MKQIYDENINLIYFVVRKFGLRDEETEEIVQDTFLRFFENQHRVDPPKARAFLVTTARNLCIDHLRKSKRQKVSLVEAEDLAQHDEDVWHNDPRRIIEAQLVEKFFDSIQNEQGADILLMFYREGLSNKQIAERLQEGVNTTTSRLSRARTKFREKLQQMLDSDWREV